VTFLLFVAVFVTLACIGVPLVTLALFVAIDRRAADEESPAILRWLRRRLRAFRAPADRFLGHNGVR
jgi:hypothetical protein